jgi:serine/threonine-protein kinase HipA
MTAGPRDGSLDLTTVQRADVYKQGALAAHLERTPHGVRFRYTDEWLRDRLTPIATTLPLTEEPVLTPGGSVPTYFAGLLPEGRRLSALQRSVKTSADDDLSLVLAIGSDAVGDVQVLPEGLSPRRARPRLQVAAFEDVQFRDLLGELDIDVDRVGLAGVQEKASLALLNLPVSAAGADYILKLNPPEYHHLVENEAFFLSRAPRSGVPAAHGTLVRDRAGEPGLVIRRFDRIGLGEDSQSFAVEDGCQVLDHYPAAKYRLPVKQVLSGLSSRCSAPIPAAQEFLRQLVFAFVTGNGDAHAKNFSILSDQHGRWVPSPAYDLPSSQPYGDSTMALSLAGKRDGNIPGSRFVALGEHLGLPTRAAARVVRETASKVDLWIDELEELPFDPGVARKLRHVITRRQSLLLNNQ